MNQLDQAFEQAKKAYPDVWVSGHELVSLPGLFDDDPEEETSIPHTWQLVDAVAASFRTPEREGMLVLQERRPQSVNPSNHWGYMISKAEMVKTEAANPYDNTDREQDYDPIDLSAEFDV